MLKNVTLLLDQKAEYCRLAVLKNGILNHIDSEKTPFDLQTFPYLNQIYRGRVISVTSNYVFVNLGRYIGLLVQESSFEQPHEGQAILVQVKREPMPDKGSLNKGPLLTRKITLGGRYCLFHPFHTKRFISSKITDSEVLALLKSFIPDNAPFTLRQSCALAEPEQIQAEMCDLLQKYAVLGTGKTNAPRQLPYDALSPSQRWLRDLIPGQVKDILVNHYDTYLQCRQYLQRNNPALVFCLKMYNGSLFAAYNLEDTWDSLFTDVVPLSEQESGGTIVFENTAAAVVIDINQGGNSAGETNDKAIPLLVRQLKWRHYGGNIIIDFAGLDSSAKNKGYLEKKLAAQCDLYNIPLEIKGWSRLGWLEARLPKRRLSLKDSLLDKKGWNFTQPKLKQDLT